MSFPHKLFKFGSIFQGNSKSEDVKLDPTNKQVYTCDACAASYTDIHTLEYHLNLHIGRILYYTKEDCDSSCVKHVEDQVVQKKSLNLKSMCFDSKISTLCSAAITHNSSLKTNDKIHSLEEPYICEICSAEFT